MTYAPFYWQVVHKAQKSMNNHRDMSGRQDGANAPDGLHHTISARLRQFYNSVQEEGIPDRFLQLLEKLDEAEKRASGEGGHVQASVRDQA